MENGFHGEWEWTQGDQECGCPSLPKCKVGGPGWMAGEGSSGHWSMSEVLLAMGKRLLDNSMVVLRN